MSALGSKLRRLEGGLAAFWCPGCNAAHQLRIEGQHAWGFNGDGDRPTFTPSVLTWGKARFLTDEESEVIRAGGKVDVPDFRCHSFVTDGRIQFLSDCSHDLAGQTVDLPDFPTDEQEPGA